MTCEKTHVKIHITSQQELGPRQYCRDNETTKLFVISILLLLLFGVATPSWHRDLNICRILSGPWGSITLILCRCRETIQLSRAQLCKFYPSPTLFRLANFNSCNVSIKIFSPHHLTKLGSKIRSGILAKMISNFVISTNFDLPMLISHPSIYSPYIIFLKFDRIFQMNRLK